MHGTDEKSIIFYSLKGPDNLEDLGVKGRYVKN